MKVQMDTLLNPPTTKRRRGQTLAEFALTLPILLLLMFGIIEFARIFQAWVTLQNAARTAARYAITGQVDENHLEVMADEFAYSIGDTAAAAEPNTASRLCAENDNRGVHADFGPYSGNFESLFANHWDGLDCEPGSEEHEGLLNDMGRIPSIRDQARVGAAGLDIRIFDEQAYQVETGGGGEFVRWANDDQPGWFHVFICSSRPTLREGDDAGNLRYVTSRDDLTCTVLEQRSPPDEAESVNNQNVIQWDAGGPGDAVEIIVTFNHPLITPLALPTYVQLQARRVMVNEAFRASRVVNLPPVLGQPTFTPSATQEPTGTATITDTPFPTETEEPTATPTSTEPPTATPEPVCDELSITGVSFSGSYLQVAFQNANFAPMYLEGVALNWETHALYPNMYADVMQINSFTHWDGTDTNPPTNVGSASSPEPTWNATANTALPGQSATSYWQVRFTNGPTRLADYYSRYDFSGSTWYFNDGCVLTLDDPTPTPSETVDPLQPPTDTPEPICGDYRLAFESFQPHGVVQFSMTNIGDTPVRLTGMDLQWLYWQEGITLDFVSVGGSNAFDPAAVVMWTGPDPTSTGSQGSTMHTTSGDLGSEGTWNMDAVVNPHERVFIWLDFDGATNIGDLGAQEAHFSGTYFSFDNGCYSQDPEAPTQVPAACGNGILEPWNGEACDDGNTVSGDGCSSICLNESSYCGDGIIDPGEECDGNDGARRCDASCHWIAECGNDYLDPGEVCDGNDGSRRCDDDLCIWIEECQNAYLDPGEVCDDGDWDNRDECNNDCEWTFCGDNYRNNRPNNHDGFREECDDGPSGSPYCTTSCTYAAAVCGDGYLQQGEECDDGNTNAGDNCSPTCEIECGNGAIDPGETCDDGNTWNGDGCDEFCQLEPVGEDCGNGVVEGDEQCDLGELNGEPGSGCTAECTVDQQTGG